MIGVNKLVNRKDKKNINEHVGELNLGSVTNEKEAFRKLFRNYGEGKFFIGEWISGDIKKLFNGYLEDKDPFLVIQIKDYNYLSEKLDLEPMDWGERGYVKIKKENPEEESIL